MKGKEPITKDKLNITNKAFIEALRETGDFKDFLELCLYPSGFLLEQLNEIEENPFFQSLSELQRNMSSRIYALAYLVAKSRERDTSKNLEPERYLSTRI